MQNWFHKCVSFLIFSSRWCCIYFINQFSVLLIMQLLIQLEDNRLIETVGIPVEDERGSMRLTACVSSQVVLSHNFLAYENFYIEA